MKTITFDEQEGAKKVGENNVIMPIPYLDSCCFVIAWLEDKSIWAQHCQDAHYKDACKIPGNGGIVQAVYITSQKTGVTEAHVRALNEYLRPTAAIYYSHKTLDKNVKPIVALNKGTNYVLYNAGEYERLEL